LRLAILGDIHGNYPALEAVLAVIDAEGVDAIACVGDVVGYAAQPKECLQVIRERARCVVAGNHDYGTVGLMDLEYFNSDARDAVEWTKSQLSQEDMDYLAQLPLTAEFEGFLIVHSTPYLPQQFSYIQTIYDAELAFAELVQQVAFVGHSHVPVTFINTEALDYFQVTSFEVSADRKMIVNVGSVGQPRDLDPRAAFAILDTEARECVIHRVDYDIEAAALAILDAGLPRMNAYRLVRGR